MELEELIEFSDLDMLLEFLTPGTYSSANGRESQNEAAALSVPGFCCLLRISNGDLQDIS